MKWILGFSAIAVIVGALATTTIPAATITPDQAILRFFPPETEGIAFIDVAGLLASPLVQDAMANRGARFPHDFQKFKDETGIDVERDVQRVTVGRIGSKEMLAVVEAQFDRVRLEQFAQQKGAQSESHMGRAVYWHDDKAFAFVDNIVLAGSYEAVKKSIDQVSLPGSASIQSDLMNAIQTVEAGNQVWAVGEFSMDQIPTDFRGPAPALELIKSFRGGTYQMRIDRDIHAVATGNFADAESARSAADLARGAIALGKLQVSKLPEPAFLQALDGIRITNSNASVVVNVDESGDVLKKLQEFRPASDRAQ